MSRTVHGSDGSIIVCCDCGRRLRIDALVAHKAARCKGCGRVYRHKSDGSYQIVGESVLKSMKPLSGASVPSPPVSLPAASPRQASEAMRPIGQGAIDKMFGIDKLTEDPNDTIHWFLEMARAAGILPSDPTRSAVDRVRQVWRVVKAKTPEIDQEAAYAMDLAIDALDSGQTEGGSE